MTDDKFKEQLEEAKGEQEMTDDTPENNPNMILYSVYRERMQELMKENIKLRSLNRRAAEEIRDLDDHLIKLINECEGAAKIIDYDIDAKSDGYWSGMSSINLLNRLDGRTNGGYVENYDDLHLEMKALDGGKWYNCAHCDAGYPDQKCACKKRGEQK